MKCLRNPIRFYTRATDSVKLFGTITEIKGKSLETFIVIRERHFIFIGNNKKKIDVCEKNQVLKMQNILLENVSVGWIPRSRMAGPVNMHL